MVFSYFFLSGQPVLQGIRSNSLESNLNSMCTRNGMLLALSPLRVLNAQNFSENQKWSQRHVNLIIYKKTRDAAEGQLQVLFESLVSKQNIDIYHSVGSLKQKILRTSYAEGIVILVAEKRDDLAELVPILDLFRKLRIILVLPDREPETIQIGYQLEPRYLSFIDRGYAEIKAVLQKMLGGGKSLEETA